jgi:hypothetical protein
MPREKLNAQYNYMFKMACYLHLAKAANEEDEFYETFFKIWFKRWPETPKDDSKESISSVEEIKKNDKKVRTNNVLIVAILTLYFIDRGLRAIIDIF